MFRLFILRIFKGKNPFKPDRNHIHHLIQKKFNIFQTFLIIQLCILFNILIFYILDYKLSVLFISILTYLVLYIIFVRKKEK